MCVLRSPVGFALSTVQKRRLSQLSLPLRSWPAIEEEEQDLLDKSLVRTIKVSSPGGTAASRLRAMSQGGSSDSIEVQILKEVQQQQ